MLYTRVMASSQKTPDLHSVCAMKVSIFYRPPPSAMSLLVIKQRRAHLPQKATYPLRPARIDRLYHLRARLQLRIPSGIPCLSKRRVEEEGKGMRVVHSEAEFITSVESAQREANSAFGDGRVFIEKYFHHPKHIEFQILADEHGNSVSILESANAPVAPPSKSY